MTQPSAPVLARYYRHSGRFAPGRLVAALAVSAAATVVLSLVYAYVTQYLPIGGYITFAITLGYAFLVALMAARLLLWAKLRNNPIAALGCLGLGALALYLSWYFWVFALLQRAGLEASAGAVLVALLQPGTLWEIIGKVNVDGAWTIKGHTPTGVELWLLWLVEAGLIVGPIVWYPGKRLREAPFCEQCDRWGTTRDLVDLQPGDPEEVRRRVEAGEFAILRALGPGGSGHWYHVSLQGCADCDSTQTLCIDAVTLTTDSNGKEKRTVKAIVNKLLLAPEQTVEIATLVAQMSAPPVEEPATEPPATPAPSNP